MSPNDKQNLRSDNEPSAGYSSVPMWLILLLGLFFYWGMVYLDRNAGGFNAKVYHPFANFEEVDAAQPKDEKAKTLIAGKKLFDPNCGACHQVDGMGAAGKAPPLVGSEWVLAPKPDRIIRVVLDGLGGPVDVKGQQWNLNMVPWKTSFDDEKIAQILSYVRSSWGNNASVVKPEQVKEIRAKTKDRQTPWTATELQAIPDR
ncbi:MAG: c-type cytochrome [Limisphaerales bacterium]